jgi:hypothetical protein
MGTLNYKQKAKSYDAEDADKILRRGRKENLTQRMQSDSHFERTEALSPSILLD